MKMSISILVLILSISSFARRIELAPIAVSGYSDTEASTNIAFTADSGLSEIRMDFKLSGCSSNCLKVAFGKDDDHNGALDVGEVETALGFDNGRFFVEDSNRGGRFEEPMSEGDTDIAMSFGLGIERDMSVMSFVATNGIGEVAFTNFSASVPQWVYRQEWNMMRVSRRGSGDSPEWFRCDLKRRSLHMILR